MVRGEVLLRGGVVVVKKYSCHTLKHTKHVTCVEKLVESGHIIEALSGCA